MPGLVLFKRRWAIGSDDFVFSSVGEIALRIAWVIALAIIFAIHKNGFNCTHGNELRAFYIGALVLNTLSVINLMILLRISMQGTIINCWPRRHIIKFIYIKLFLVLPETAWICLSSYWAFGHSFTCNWSVVWTVRGAVICGWIVGVFMFVGILIVFDPAGSAVYNRSISCRMSSGQNPEISVSSTSVTRKVWEKRCRVLCCCVTWNADTSEAFMDISNIMAEFFRDVDLVPTDIAAGLVLVQQQQEDTESRLASVVTETMSQPAEARSSVTVDNSLHEPKPWMTICNMKHYMKFAMGSYGWPFYVYENLLTGVCRLFPHCRFCACCRRQNGVASDNICQCNTAAIKGFSNVSDEELIYVTFHNEFKQVPFYVVADHSSQAVVVSIRGTLSFNDALADLSATGSKLDVEGVPEAYCHAAMLDCAVYIQQKLMDLHILETAFAQFETEALLVITGHSLGAGVAAILALLLRPQYPDLRCFSFSPPGGLMSPSLSKYARDFVCSVVVGKDLVPRLGMYTLVDLKIKLLKALCQCQEPKYKILAAGCFRLLCSSKRSRTNRPSNSADSFTDSRSVQERTPVLQESILQGTLRSAEQQFEQILKSPWPMHPAGCILHIIETSPTSPSGDRRMPTYAAIWSKPEYYDKILISQKMVSDHIPNVVYHALEQLCDRNCEPLYIQPFPSSDC